LELIRKNSEIDAGIDPKAEEDILNPTDKTE